jgi:hypothetical protein
LDQQCKLKDGSNILFELILYLLPINYSSLIWGESFLKENTKKLGFFVDTMAAERTASLLDFDRGIPASSAGIKVEPELS